MPMTDKKRRFAAARMAGSSNKDAAIAAGYSEKTAAAAGSRLAKDKDVLAEIARKGAVKAAKEEAKESGREINLPDLARMYSDPRDFLVALMNDVAEDVRLRLDAAKALMPFTHQKKGEGGKKEQRNEDAKKVASRFAPSAPPKLVAAGGKTV